MAASGRWNLQTLDVIRAFVCRLTRKAATLIPEIGSSSFPAFFLQETVKPRRLSQTRPDFADHRSQWIGRSGATAGATTAYFARRNQLFFSEGARPWPNRPSYWLV